jgi:hypothetical protein
MPRLRADRARAAALPPCTAARSAARTPQPQRRGSRLRRDAEARRFTAYAARFGLAGDAAAHAPRVPAC